MHSVKTYLVLCTLLVPLASFAGQEEYDDCILKHLKGAKLDIATHTIKTACYENFKKLSHTPEKQRAYNNCLLDHLPGVESLQAVMEIRSACESKHL